MSDDLVRYDLEEGVAVLRFDDGKANAFSYAALEALNGALDRAEKDEAKALVLVGRPGRFSAGFDLSVMSQGIEQALPLVGEGARFAVRIYDWPTPCVFAVTGHALAMGAVLLLAADERIGAEGSFKIGLNEVAIGMTLPEFALEFARQRLSKRHLQRATTGAEIYDPEGAVDAGYLDAVAPADQVEAQAIARARELGAGLHAAAFRNTKRALRKDGLERLRAASQG